MRQRCDFTEKWELEREILAHPAFSGGTLKFLRRLSANHSQLSEYTFQSTTETKLLVVKQQAFGPKSEDVTLQEFANLNRVRSLLGPALAGSVPEPLLTLPEKATLVTTRVPGVSLSLILKRCGNRFVGPFRSSALAEIAQRVGAWLRVFQKTTQKPPLPFSRDSYLAALKMWLSEAQGKGLGSELAGEILQRLSDYTLPLNGRLISASGKHGDFIPQNILVEDTSIAVVDFEGFAEHEPIYDDVGMFLGYLFVLKARAFYSWRSLGAVRNGFLRGFLSEDEIEEALLNIYTLKSVVRIIADGPPITGNRNSVGAARLLPRLLKELTSGKQTESRLSFKRLG